ncbi:UBXN6 [Symbiodinium pilosum]|uniref:UBXN6 protein n=1 Tax=Symbiodinium pilosum TaxID=2952 RepID=A0A812IU51_SYMPI|nr:UBXN6 [Symbiodinium pilosum]
MAPVLAAGGAATPSIPPPTVCLKGQGHVMSDGHQQGMLIFVGPDFGTLSCVSYQRPRENSNIQDSSCASAQAALSLPIVGSLNSQYSHDTVGATSTVGRPARENDDDEEELEDIPVAPAVMLSDLAAQVGSGEAFRHGYLFLFDRSDAPGPAYHIWIDHLEYELHATAFVEASLFARYRPPAPPVAAPEAVPPAASTDPVLLALKELRRTYREANPAALAAGLRIVSGCIGHLVTHPQETKYHRINCGGERFRARVASLEGAVAILEACGFRGEGEFLQVDEDYPRTHGLLLRDAKAKVDVVLGELEKAGYTG